jgi:hypothetical protein
MLCFLILGCTSNKSDTTNNTSGTVYSNPDYPYFNITNVSTDRAEINHYTINVTITSNVPERTIKFENGSIVNTGKNCTQAISISISMWSYYHHGMLPYNSINENATLAYNESKVFTYDLGALTPGYYTITVSSKYTNMTYNAQMWYYGI